MTKPTHDRPDDNPFPHADPDEIRLALQHLEGQLVEIERTTPGFYAEAEKLRDTLHTVLGTNSRECVVVAAMMLQRDMAQEQLDALTGGGGS